MPVALRRGAHEARASAGHHSGRARTPAEGPLVDRYGRVHTDLRVSVTDRCNLRCVYCMPEEGVPFRPRAEILSFVARVARSLGVRSLRLTGGEPLVRRGVVELVRQIAAVGFDDIALTTNGTRLSPVAHELARAGLRRVNISCDSLRPRRYAQIRRRGDLAAVLAAMDVAEAAGLEPIKVNVVVIAGVNDDEVPVRTLLRTGASDEDLAMALRRSVWGKLPGHGINESGFLRPTRSMSMIGG